MTNLRVPRKLMEFFNDTRDREIQRFFQDLQNLLTGSETSLSDQDQRSSTPALSRLSGIEKELADIRRSDRHRNNAEVQEILKRLDDLEAQIR